MLKQIKYSVIIPIFNEEEVIQELWQRLHKVLKELDGNSEVIFINDGSYDDSLEILIQIRLSHPEVKIINFSRNFGHQCSLSAGIDHAKGKAVILMDGDLQDAPEAIFGFVEKWKQGYAVVYAIRKKRKENFVKNLTFTLFYRILNALAGLKLPLDAGIFSLMDRKVILALRSMPEQNKYISGLRAYAGFKQIGVPVERGPRFRGEPRVTVVKLFKLAFDGIFSFSTLPLKIATFLGIVSSISAFILGLTGLFFKFILEQDFLNWTYGLTTTFFIGGIQLFFLGIIGEYIGRIYDEVKQRPYYIIDEKIGFQEEVNYYESSQQISE
ncbi:glycosyltransferase [Nostoc sp. 'Peltigera membranacea cyanobiont' 213]|uniref:glycosyltransferase family 2 protein n=1 Tax=Nostoc sp. 'Peltigera membranacea cyanobiont' 213 TaxID=2014530 RepID=UPI000B958359|nr:glycosyltransferase family 2 protein [Nostoc sp. 'Peltigera membranacea cyanobiont' 213]OYD93529.1 glycosyltransferase [Nostoc sp. 'Peltigera membranacea cyanobiont' 213]